MEHIFVPSKQVMSSFAFMENNQVADVQQKSRKASTKTIILKILSSLRLFSLLFPSHAASRQ